MSKCLVSFGLRGVVGPLFAGKLEHAIEPHLDKIDSKTAENILFFIDGTGQTRGSSFNCSLVSLIQSKNWVEKGVLNDYLLIIRLLSQNTNMIKADNLLEQIEKVVCKQFFDGGINDKAASYFDLISLYAFEFSKVSFEFGDFYKSYFDFIKENRPLIQ